MPPIPQTEASFPASHYIEWLAMKGPLLVPVTITVANSTPPQGCTITFSYCIGILIEIRMYLCSLGVCHIAPAIIFNSELSATWYNIIASTKACHVPKGKELTRKNKIE